MRELIYHVGVGLDGRIAGPEGELGYFPYDELYARRLSEEWGDGLPSHLHAMLGTKPSREKWDTAVMGRGTYEPGLRAGVTDPYEHLTTYVYSRSLDPEACPDVTVVAEDPVEHVRALKQGPGGNIWLCGGGTLAAALAGEVDRLVLKIYPVTAGDGIALFEGEFSPALWRLERTESLPLDVILAEYTRAG